MPLSHEDKRIIVNYHYVEDLRGDFSGIHPCAIKEFESQIRFLSKNFNICGISDVYNAAKNDLPEKYCAITLDDGLKDQYINAVPTLKKYKAYAMFFPITSTFSGKIPPTSKIHILLSNFSSEELIDLTNNFTGEYYPESSAKYKIPKDKRITEKRKLRDGVLTANFKETINILPNDIGKNLLNWLFERLDLDEKKLCDELFMTKNEIGDIRTQGFEIGNHTHEHLALDVQDKEHIKEDLKRSNKILENLTGKKPAVFSYPHGGTNDTAREAVKEEGFDFAVTIKRAPVQKDSDRLLLPRYDTKDINDLILKSEL